MVRSEAPMAPPHMDRSPPDTTMVTRIREKPILKLSGLMTVT